MYWWNYKKLAEALRDDRVSEKQSMLYLIVITLIDLLAYFQFPTEFTLLNIAPIIFSTGAFLLSIVMAYNINISGDSKDFLKRFICISLPITVRIMLSAIFMGILTLIVVVARCHCEDDELAKILDHGTIEGLILTIPLCVYALAMTVKAFRIASTKVPA